MNSYHHTVALMAASEWAKTNPPTGKDPATFAEKVGEVYRICFAASQPGYSSPVTDLVSSTEQSMSPERLQGPDDTEGTGVTEPSPPTPIPGLVAGVTLGDLLRRGAFE